MANNIQNQNSKVADCKMSNDFYLRYYVGHKGKFGHEFLEFEFRPDGKLRYGRILHLSKYSVALVAQMASSGMKGSPISWNIQYSQLLSDMQTTATTKMTQ